MPNSEKKHLLIFTEVYCGPTMTFIVRQIEELMKTYDVTVLSNRRENEEIYTGTPIIVPYDIGSRIISKVIRTLGYSYRIPPLNMLKKIKHIHQKKKIDGVICHFGPAGLQLAKVLEKLDIPQSIIIHGYDGSSLLNNKSYLRQIRRSRSVKWIFASNSLRDNFLKYIPKLENYMTIHLGIKLPTIVDNKKTSIEHKVQNGEKIVFFQAANFVEKKGHQYTISVFKDLLIKYTNAELIFAGGGELQPQMENLVKKLNIESKVKFLGHLSSDNVLQIMSKSDVFLHHSVTAVNGDQESIPTVIMEAMSYGIPVISTIHSGIPELIQSGTDGILVQERNLTDYKKAMINILSENGEMSTNAKSKVSKYFSFENNLSKIVEFTINK